MRPRHLAILMGALWRKGKHKSLMEWAEARKRREQAGEGMCRHPWGKPCWEGRLRIRARGESLLPLEEGKRYV